MPRMSLREYARHRGCTLHAVQRAIETHRVEVVATEQRGSRVYSFVDSDQADATWLDRTDPGRQHVATRAESGTAEKQGATDKTDGDTAAPKAEKGTPVGGVGKGTVSKFGDVYSKGRAVRETFAAKMAALEYEEKLGKVVGVDKVKVAFFNVANGVQQNMLAIPPRIAAQVAAAYQAAVSKVISQTEAGQPVSREQLETVLKTVADEKLVSDIMNDEIKTALRQLADGKIRF